MMSEYVCVKDGRILRIQKNSVLAELLDGAGESYKIFYADRWGCPKCGFAILVTAPNAVAEHFQEEHYDRIKRGVDLSFQH